MKKALSVFMVLILAVTLIMSFTACNEKKHDGGHGYPVFPGYPPNDTYTYHYNDATAGVTEKSIDLEPENYANKTLIVPTRDGYVFDGWYADWIFKKRVTDAQGCIVIGDELFDIKSNDLYAKWTNDNAPEFPILMVFVTSVDALLKTIDGVEIKVDYTMTDVERKVCELLPPMLKDYLNALLNGAVKFKVDTVFTTQAIGSRSFVPTIGTGLGNDIPHYSYCTDADFIPELGGMEIPEMSPRPPISEIEGNGLLSKYKSIITSFNMNDLNEKLHFVGGSAHRKYASIHLEAVYGNIIRQGGTPDLLLNFEEEWVHSWWLAFMALYLHEFTHTVECYWENKEINPIDYHKAYGKYSYKITDKPSGKKEIEFIRLYLQYQAEIDGVKLGIPNSFWYLD